MSNISYYSQLWLVAKNDLEKLLELDQNILAEKPPKKKEEAMTIRLQLYLRYRNIVQRLVICHDQMVHSQKRTLLKEMLDCAIGRMLEYKRDIVGIDFTEYEWPDNLLNLMKMTPDDLDLKTPAYYTADRKSLLQERRLLIEDLFNTADKEPSESARRSDLAASSSTMGFEGSKVRRNKSRFASKIQVSPVVFETPEQMAAREAREAEEAKKKEFKAAILLIQSHERARVARCIGASAERRYHYSMKLMLGLPVPKEPTHEERQAAALVIQKHYRGYIERRDLERKFTSTENVLDMSIPSWKSREIMKKAEENFTQKLSLHYPHVLRVEEATAVEKSRILKIRGPGLIEDITDEIREWFILWYNELGFFDVFPAAEAGGSVLIVTGETLSPEEYLIQKLEEEQGTTVDKQADDEEPKKQPKYKMKDSKVLPFLADANEDFVANWSLRMDGETREEDINFDLIKSKLCHELQLDVRKTVDDLMRLELNKLNEALRRDHAEDPDFEVPTVSTAKDVPVVKKKKERKNLLPDEHIEDIFKELVHLQVIRNYPQTRLADWIGDLSFQNYEAGTEFREYHNRLGEIVQLIMEYCILPMGSQRVHEIAPLVKAVAICGPPMYGKTFLANAICSELGALLFDLTPDNLIGRFTDKEDFKRLFKTVSTVSRAYAPSIIFVDGGEKPWLKRVPPELQDADPKKYGPVIKKLASGIKAGDQVLLLTVSSAPNKAAKPYVKIHNKFIFLPVTDYGTMYLFYKNLLMQYHGIDRGLDVSCLAKVSAGLPLEVVRTAIEETLTAERRMTLKFRPLDQREIYDKIMEYRDPTPNAVADLIKFQASTPLEKKRQKLLKKEAEEREAELKAAGN